MTRTVLSANDAFWLSPLMDMSVNDITDDDYCAATADAANDSSDTSTTINPCSSLNDDLGSSSSSLPPAHYQLLSTEQVPTYSELKGYDHSIQESPTVVCYSSDSEGEEVSYNRGGSISSVKQQGGGSWLLGTFARLNHAQQAIVDDIDKSINEEEQERQDAIPPDLVRVASGSSLESDDTESLNSSISSSSSTKKRRSGVSFSTSVKIQPIPHSSTLSPTQRRNMYSSSYEVRLNKVRNKKEYKYDGYDWRSVTEEWEMGVDMISGELVHPVHEQLA